MDQEVQHLPQKSPQRVPRPLLLAKGKEGVRRQETGVRKKKA
jgi:hypothetical protein